MSVMTYRIGVYAGSFDPITLGHVWVIETASKLFDQFHVVIADNPAKKYMFGSPRRWGLVHGAIKHIQKTHLYTTSLSLSVPEQNKFIANYAMKLEAKAPGMQGQEQRYIVRGVRSVADYEFERQMVEINKKIQPEVETIILIPPPELSSISSSAVKGLVGPEGWEQVVKPYVPECVLLALRDQSEGK
jgi:pantetheine-phosphate adenylyltransferase